MIEINNVLESVLLSVDEVVKKTLKKHQISSDELLEYKIIKRSLDARKELSYLYNFAFKLKDESKYNFKEYVEEKLVISKVKEKKKVAVIGFGPSGAFSADILNHAGYDVSVFERGKKVEERIKDVDKFFNEGILNEESNIQFGEGGAGTFSDGKLNSRTKHLSSAYVLDKFHSMGAAEEIKYVHNPHIGSDVLRKVMINFRNDLIKRGVKINFNSLVSDFIIKDDQIKAIKVNDEILEFDYVLLCLGHSSRDTFKTLYERGVKMEAKSYSLGFRVEHLQKRINLAQYKLDNYIEKLGAAEYRLINKEDGCYTFCMCPGGVLLNATNYQFQNVTNGMSDYLRDSKYANSAILVNVLTEDVSGDSVFKMMDLQIEIEKKAYMLTGSYQLPVQNITDFLGQTKSKKLVFEPSIKNGYLMADLKKLYPSNITQKIQKSLVLFEKRVKGFKNGIIVGAETRSSSPIRILRNVDTLESNIKNVYPVGEGAGYAGGITSASMDGIKTALKIIERDI